MFYDFYGFLAVSHYFDNFYPQKRLIWQIMDFKKSENRQTANMAVFRRFWAVFVVFKVVFHYFGDF